ncbi:MAG: 1-(5-phosphoribosyl)-5-[(5-phosphoribosylamino)methylideneamino]imidazole-4-carboxamide isomerase [Polyangiaceae bacterium]|nr:1-(5-phosphoribosyl)-5-[(5-phosphoribosylamino)methylideneamino]imidazole-4-carboxamide isomerase [Polyangiaceae bacterium]
MDLYPAIDLLGGSAVRLRQGSYEDVTRYSIDPVELAAGWRGRAGHLHVVDLEGAREGFPVQRALVRRVVEAFGRGVQVGGGVRTRVAAEAYLELGADRVVLGTAALEDREMVEQLSAAHPGRVVVALDARDGRVATRGWLEQSATLATELLAELAALPLAGVLYTDIARDGMEQGPNVDATVRLARSTSIPVIASGGVGSIEHVARLARHREIAGAIVGRALHEGRFTLDAALAAARGDAPVSV